MARDILRPWCAVVDRHSGLARFDQKLQQPPQRTGLADIVGHAIPEFQKADKGGFPPDLPIL
jgi:hypothetical protein